MEPIEIVEAFGAAWGAHDLEATLALVTDDCVFESTGPAPDGTRHVGRDDVRAARGSPSSTTSHARSSRWRRPSLRATGSSQRWRYSWADGHVRGVDVFRVRDGLVAEKLSYVKG